MTRKKQEKIGEKLGYITIIDERRGRGYRIFKMKCDLCGSEKEVTHSQYNSGSWDVCEHDALWERQTSKTL